jgi:hypothetical protein
MQHQLAAAAAAILGCQLRELVLEQRLQQDRKATQEMEIRLGQWLGALQLAVAVLGC